MRRRWKLRPEPRRRIPAVAPPPAHGGLRDWDAREARVLAAALSVVIARLCDGSPSVDATQHAIPASLGLMDASDASTRFVGLECLVRIVTRAPPIILDELHPILLDALDRARALIARDGGGETVALYAHGAVLVIGKVLEPSVRRRAAAVFLDACLDDRGWGDNAAKLELLRRLADVTLLLAPRRRRAHPAAAAPAPARRARRARAGGAPRRRAPRAPRRRRPDLGARRGTARPSSALLLRRGPGAARPRPRRGGGGGGGRRRAAAAAGLGLLAGLAGALAVRALALVLAACDGAASGALRPRRRSGSPEPRPSSSPRWRRVGAALLHTAMDIANEPTYYRKPADPRRPTDGATTCWRGAATAGSRLHA